MACMMMASRRARATRAFRIVERLPTRSAQSLRQIAAIAGEHDVRGLVEQGANPSIATLRDAARVVDLSGFPAPGHKPQIRADVPRRAEAIRSIDGGDKGERRQLADPGYGHQPPAGLRRAG